MSSFLKFNGGFWLYIGQMWVLLNSFDNISWLNCTSFNFYENLRKYLSIRGASDFDSELLWDEVNFSGFLNSSAFLREVKKENRYRLSSQYPFQHH